MSHRVLFFGLLLLTLLAANVYPRAQNRRIRVGPNVLVSRDDPTPNTELMLAANPTAAANLIVSEPCAGSMSRTTAACCGCRFRRAARAWMQRSTSSVQR